MVIFHSYVELPEGTQGVKNMIFMWEKSMISDFRRIPMNLLRWMILIWLLGGEKRWVMKDDVPSDKGDESRRSALSHVIIHPSIHP